MRLVRTRFPTLIQFCVWMVLLDHCHPGKQDITISESTAVHPHLKWTLPSLPDYGVSTTGGNLAFRDLLSLLRGCPLTVCSWLCKTCTWKRPPHAWVKSSMLFSTPRALSGLLSTETHTRTSSGSIVANGTRDSMVSWRPAFSKRNWRGY